MTRPVSAASLKPWQAAGMSRATWYRRRSVETPVRLSQPMQSLTDFLRIATLRYPKDRIGDLDGALAALQRCIDAGFARGRIANALSAIAYAAFAGADVPLLSDALLSMIDNRLTDCNGEKRTTDDDDPSAPKRAPIDPRR
jgi:hypothetical protein